MAVQEAKRFVDELIANPKLTEELRVDAPQDVSVSDYYASVAANRGYDFTVEELEAELKARQEASITVVDGAELNDTELEQVAGGGWCWFNEYCTTAILYQKKDERCKTTYDYSEHCFAADKCPDVVITY